jgi:glycosyltransferase involved in cell wall biosynthesis
MTRCSVVILTQGFRPGGGGVTSAARWLQRELSSSDGYDVSVYVLATSRNDAHSRRIMHPATWFRKSLRTAVDRGVEHWGANAVELEPMRYRPRRELTAALNQHDLVHVVAGGPAIGQVCRDTRRRVVLQVATTAASERESRIQAFRYGTRWWHRLMTALTTRAELRAIAAADAVMVMNDDMLGHVERLGHKSAYWAPPGIDVDVYRPLTPWSSRGYLLSLCRLDEPRKGLERLVLAYAKLRCEEPSAPPLVLAGKGRLPPALRALIAENGLESQVDVRGDVPAGELPHLFDGASVYWQASHEEGFGISVVEAMACGLPVVATDTAGTRMTVVDGVTGWLVPQDEEGLLIQAFADRTRELLSTDGAAFAASGRQRAVDDFAADVALARIFDVYSRLLGEPGTLVQGR